MVFEYRVLRSRIFGPEREEIRGEWKGLFTEALRIFKICTSREIS